MHHDAWPDCGDGPKQLSVRGPIKLNLIASGMDDHDAERQRFEVVLELEALS
jgi:hypothetical protein